MPLTHFYCAGVVDSSVILSTFVASIRAVGQSATLAAAGAWLARTGVMTPALSKGLSRLSVTVAIPALLFTSVVPGFTPSLLSFAWPLLLLPGLYLALGAAVGGLTLLVVRPRDDFRLGLVAACAFGNTTGIPIVLLSVLQQSLSRSIFAEIADPLLFLSFSLLTYPTFQWLASLLLLRRRTYFRPETPELPAMRRHGPTEASNSYISMMSVGEDESHGGQYRQFETLLQQQQQGALRPPSVSERLGALVSAGGETLVATAGGALASCAKVLRRALVPQVVGIGAGALVGLFGRPLVLPPETAPLGWCYLGVTKLGAAAVPINLILLGAALSRPPAGGELPPLAAAGIIVARMVLMPLCGLAVARGLSALRLDVPYAVADPFWLVCLILTCTPTANNIVVMCDLAGENRRAMSASIFYQYLAAPLLLPGVLTTFVAFICRTREAG